MSNDADNLKYLYIVRVVYVIVKYNESERMGTSHLVFSSLSNI